MTLAPKVSVVLHAFNQEGYIKDALDGILKQKTKFPFEVIVHDDASTDSTTDIIKNYHSKYPDIIIPIIQTQNQYSLGIKPSTITTPHARGEYIAFCEGDDYWCCSEKLESQIDFMEKNPDVTLCATSCFLDFSSTQGGLVKKNIKEGVWSSSELAKEGGGALPTASLVFKREVFDDLGAWFHAAPLGDYYLQVLASMTGKVHVLPTYTCVYRVNALGSWSSRSFTRKALFERTEKTESLLNYPDFIEAYSRPVARLMVGRTFYTAFASSLKSKNILDSLFFLKKSFQYCKRINPKQSVAGAFLLFIPAKFFGMLIQRQPTLREKED